MTIAQTILQQLGGNRFIAMTGAKNLVADNAALAFKLPANIAKDGINYVRVTLQNNDLYSISFTKFRGLVVKEVSAFADVYADQLQGIFTTNTGLDTRI